MPGASMTMLEPSPAFPLASPPLPSSLPSPASHPHAHIVAPDDKGTVALCVEAIASAFASEALVAAFAAEAGKSVHEYIDGAFRASLGSGRGTLVEAGRVSAVALWELPEEDDDEGVTSDDGSGGLGGARDEREDEGAGGERNDGSAVAENSRLLPAGQLGKPAPRKGNAKGVGWRTIAAAHGSGAVGPVKKEWKAIVRRGKEKHIGLANPMSGASQTSPDPSSTISPHDRHHHQRHHHHVLPSLNPHYHLDFLARNPNSSKVPGAVSAVVKPLLARARREGRSVWLETSSAEVVSMYEYFGFRTVEEVMVGASKGARDGRLREDGKGIKAWLMLVDNRCGPMAGKS